jgi:uncharacterized protein (TIGR03067 family)
MKLTALFLAAATFATGTALAQADKAERAKLVGTWEGWIVEGDGSTKAQQRQRVSEMVITATEISAKDGGGRSMGTGTYQTGGSGALRTMDNTGTGGPTAGKRFMGVYRLEGDTLKWCSGNDRARTRPTELRTNTGQNHFLMILTKKK